VALASFMAASHCTKPATSRSGWIAARSLTQASRGRIHRIAAGSTPLSTSQ
jgi:hypothetical protein